MKQFIRNLSAPAEFCLVLLIGFGIGMVYQAAGLIWGITFVINDEHMLPNLLQKLLELALILWIGRVRGWSVSTFGWRITWKGTLGGILLFLVVTTVKLAVGISLAIVHPEPPRVSFVGLSVPVIILVALINPFFEEVLEAGFFIGALRRYGVWVCVLASGILRGILHVYQGWNGMTPIFTGGLIMGFAYWRWRQLWPLVVAHFLDDFIGLLYFSLR